VRLHAQAPDDSLKPGIAVGARDLPRGSRAKKVPSTFAVAAVGGVRLLAELAERRFVFALDLIEALMDEGKVIGYSCCHWEPLKRRGLFVPILAVSEPTPSTEAPYLVRARDYIFVIELKNRRLKISPQQAGALNPLFN
jgi:hypothetical protein